MRKERKMQRDGKLCRRKKAKPLHQLENKLDVVRARNKLLESQEVRLRYLQASYRRSAWFPKV